MEAWITLGGELRELGHAGAVVGRRLKQSGMFWSEAGAENLLRLRCLLLGPYASAARAHIVARHQAKARRWSPPELAAAA